jgi:hypothetical protein
VGEFYRGQYGKSFRLYGWIIVIPMHTKELWSFMGMIACRMKKFIQEFFVTVLGCVMVSYKFFDRLSHIIEKSEKPIILWVYE